MKFLLTISFILPLLFSSTYLYAEENLSDTTYFSINNDSSKVEWACDLHHGFILLENGELALVDNELVAGEFKICMGSITDLDIDYDLMRETLQNTLKSIEFFNTEIYHYSSFDIDYVDNTNKIIYGDLTFLGVAKCVELKYNLTLSNDSIVAISQEITIDRSDWGSISMSKEDAKCDKSFIVPNDVKIKVTLVGTKSQTE